MKDSKNFIKTLKSKGWIQVKNRLLPPGHKDIPDKPLQDKPYKIRTGWIDDSRNIKNKNIKTDMFMKLINQEMNIEVWPEFFFSTQRLYRFDYAIPITPNSGELKIAIEVQGGIFMKGNSGHSSGTGIKRDMDKANLAQSLGWFIIKLTPEELLTIKTLDLIKCAIQSRN